VACFPEHQRSNLHRANPAFQIKLIRQCHARKLRHRTCGRNARASIYMACPPAAARWARLRSRCDFPETRGSDAVFSTPPRALRSSDGNASRCVPQVRRSRKAFGQNQQIFLLLRQRIVIGAEKPANIGHASFFCGHGAAGPHAKYLRAFSREFFSRSPARAIL